MYKVRGFDITLYLFYAVFGWTRRDSTSGSSHFKMASAVSFPYVRPSLFYVCSLRKAFVLDYFVLFSSFFCCPRVILSVCVILIFRFRIKFAAIDFDQHICPVIKLCMYIFLS